MKKILSFVIILMSVFLPFSMLGCGKTPEYSISVVANNTSYGSVTGSGSYKEGSIITISATANNGYYFHSWDDGYTKATRNITVLEDKTYIARFYKSSSQTQNYKLDSVSIYFSSVYCQAKKVNLCFASISDHESHKSLGAYNENHQTYSYDNGIVLFDKSKSIKRDSSNPFNIQITEQNSYLEGQQAEFYVFSGIGCLVSDTVSSNENHIGGIANTIFTVEVSSESTEQIFYKDNAHDYTIFIKFNFSKL